MHASRRKKRGTARRTSAKNQYPLSAPLRFDASFFFLHTGPVYCLALRYHLCRAPLILVRERLCRYPQLFSAGNRMGWMRRVVSFLPLPAHTHTFQYTASTSMQKQRKPRELFVRFHSFLLPLFLLFLLAPCSLTFLVTLQETSKEETEKGHGMGRKRGGKCGRFGGWLLVCGSAKGHRAFLFWLRCCCCVALCCACLAVPCLSSSLSLPLLLLWTRRQCMHACA